MNAIGLIALWIALVRELPGAGIVLCVYVYTMLAGHLWVVWRCGREGRKPTKADHDEGRWVVVAWAWGLGVMIAVSYLRGHF